MDWTALWVSVRLAARPRWRCCVVGIPIAYWIAFSPRRWKFLVEAVVALPLVLPPTVLGFYILVAIGPAGPFGRWYASLFGARAALLVRGLVIASVLYSLPFAVQPFSARSRAWTAGCSRPRGRLGVSRLATFLRVVLPLSVRGLVTGMVLSFAHTLGEFGVVLMVGGNLPGVTRTVSVSIYDAVQSLDYRGGVADLAAAAGVSFVILAVHVCAAAIGMDSRASLTVRTAGREALCERLHRLAGARAAMVRRGRSWCCSDRPGPGRRRS